MIQVTSSLDLIQIASPCTASWDEMAGDQRVRFCSHCRLNVYNLSEMSHQQAEAFIQQREGRTCVRFFRREDGTVLTRDCPVGIRALRQRFIRAISAIAALVVASLSATLLANSLNRRLPNGLSRPAETFANWVNPRRYVVLGDVAVMGGCPAPPVQQAPVMQLEPPKMPLLEPTEEQLEEIQRWLAR